MSANSQLDPLAGVLFDNSFLGVLITSKGKIELVNDHAVKMLGYSADELKQKRLDDLVKVTDNSLVGSVSELIESAMHRAVRCQIEVKDKSYLPVDLNIRKYCEKDSEKGSDKAVVMLSDARTEELIEELKREFITKVSSDLRSPLTAISGSLAILRSERMARLSDSVKNVVTIAERNCKRLILMVNEIIDLESLESGKIRLQPRRTDFRDLAKQAVEMVSSYCDENSVTINNRANPMPILGDEERLTQVIANVLRNAIRLSPAGGTVEIESTDEHGWAELKIRFTAKEDSERTASDSLADTLAVRSLEVCKEVLALHKGYFGFEDGAEISGKIYKIYWVRLPAATR